MAAYLHGTSAVLLILLMILVGFICARLRVVKSEHKAFIVKYLINVAVPAMCIANVFGQFATLALSEVLWLFVPPLLSMFITLAIAIGAAKLFRLSHEHSGAFIVMCAFSNSIFVGLPLCKELFGDAAVPYVIIFYIVNTLMFWTFGVALLKRSAQKDGEKRGILDVLRSIATPPLISLLLAMALVALNVRLPQLALTLCGYFGDTVSPLALFYVGIVISEALAKREKHTVHLSTIFVMLMRFVLAPAITYVLCRLCAVSGVAAGVTVAESAMPVMTQCVIMSAACGGDEDYAASGMTVSVFICLVAMPLLYMLLNTV